MSHLDAIKNNILALELWAIGTLSLRCSIFDVIAIPTEAELVRLQEHPELFPTEKVKEDFWLYVFEVSDSIAEQWIPEELCCQSEHAEARDLAVSSVQEELLPFGHKARKPWEQFLHNKAPGSGVDLSTLGLALSLPNERPRASIQIMPTAAMRLLRAMRIDYEAIHDGIHEVRSRQIHGARP